MSKNNKNTNSEYFLMHEEQLKIAHKTIKSQQHSTEFITITM